jgi:hypothetical protein
MYFEIITVVLFVVLFTIGYRKSNRNIMLVASVCLLIGLAGPDFVKGFQDGRQVSGIAS